MTYAPGGMGGGGGTCLIMNFLLISHEQLAYFVPKNLYKRGTFGVRVVTSVTNNLVNYIVSGKCAHNLVICYELKLSRWLIDLGNHIFIIVPTK